MRFWAVWVYHSLDDILSKADNYFGTADALACAMDNLTVHVDASEQVTLDKFNAMAAVAGRFAISSRIC